MDSVIKEAMQEVRGVLKVGKRRHINNYNRLSEEDLRALSSKFGEKGVSQYKKYIQKIQQEGK